MSSATFLSYVGKRWHKMSNGFSVLIETYTVKPTGRYWPAGKKKNVSDLTKAQRRVA